MSSGTIKQSHAYLAVTSVILSAASARAALPLLQFAPCPPSPGDPEFEWTGERFQHVAGGAGDGDAGLAPQTPGGLHVQTPLILAAVAGGTVDAEGTHVNGVTLTITGLAASGMATRFVDLGQTIQPLDQGTLQLTATDGTLLVTGLLTNNSLTLSADDASSLILSATVSYTGGLIFDALTAAGAHHPSSLMSIFMVSTSGTVVVTPAGPVEGAFPLRSQSSNISAFRADATGAFDIPEPASICAFVSGAASLGRRRSRSK